MLKQYWFSSFLFTLIWVAMYFGLLSATQAQTWQQDVRYQIEAELDTTAKRLNGKMRIFYQNNSPDTLREIYLQVPSNAFHDEENTAVKEMRRFTSGNVEFDQRRGYKLTIQSLQFLSIGKETAFPLQAYDFSDTILDLTLPYALPPGDTLALGVTFYQVFKGEETDSRKVEIPSEFVQWFPNLTVYDEEGSHAEPFHFLMESFDVYSEFADFEVILTVPGNYFVVGSGDIVEGDPGWNTVLADTSWDREAFVAWRDSIRHRLKEVGKRDGPRRVYFKARKLQNFTWSASPEFIYYRYDYKVPVHIFYRGKEAKVWLTQLLGRFDPVFQYLEEHFGTYPFPHLNIVRTRSEPMAEPMMASLSDNTDFDLAYELSSIYFPGMVGSNGVTESWLAKGLQVYMGKSFSEKVHGKRGYDIKEAQEDMSWFEKQYPLPTLDDLVRNVTRLYMESGQNEPISNTIYGYKDPIGTVFNVYLKAEIFYEMLRYVVGDSVFKAATRELVHRHAFTHIKERDLLTVFEDSYGQDMNWFFDQWLRGTPTVDYSKGKVEKYQRGDTTWVTEVEVKRKGDGIMPVDVELDLGDGEKLVKRWDGKSATAKVVFETSQKPKGVKVDPDDRIMDSNQLNNRRPRLEFRPDFPLMRYIHMPGDAFLVLWRPLIDYNRHDSVRLGLRTTSSYRAFYHNVILEAMFGVASREIDAKLAYSHPMSRRNLFNRYSLMVRKNEGRFEADVHLAFKGSEGILAKSGRSLEIGFNYSRLLNGVYTFRKVANDSGKVRIDEWQDGDILLAYGEGGIQHRIGELNGVARLRLEAALPGGTAQFTKLSSRLQLTYQRFGVKGQVQGNFATSFGPDRLPLQDQFRAEGAAPRERFQNDLLKTGDALSSFSHRYVEGGGFLRGYAGLPLPAERYATVNLELVLKKRLFIFRPFGFYDTGRIWATRNGPVFTRSDAGVGLSFLFEELQLFGGNLGLFSGLTSKLFFPLWLSDPPTGEAKTQFRWYLSFGKAL